MNLPSPSAQYSQQDQQNVRGAIEKADAANVKQGNDYEVGKGKVILKSPSGARWALTASDIGVLTLTAL